MVRSASAFLLLLAFSTPALGQTMVIKHISDFATPGGGGYPNDSINDHQAFRDAAAFFQARNGFGTLILDNGEYIMGAQQLRNGTDPPMTDGWNVHGYPGGVSPQCVSLVAWQDGSVLDSCVNFTIQGGAHTRVRYRDCLYYGTFLRDAVSDAVSSAVGIPAARPAASPVQIRCCCPRTSTSRCCTPKWAPCSPSGIATASRCTTWN